MISLLLSIGLVGTFNQHVDKAAHFGVSYASTHVCQVTLDKVMDDKIASTALCAGAVMAAGSVRELTGNNDPKDMAANVAGIGLAVIFISIDW